MKSRCVALTVLVVGLAFTACGPTIDAPLVPAASGTALPEGWQSTDVGTTGAPGSTLYSSDTGTFTVSGSGNGVPNRDRRGPGSDINLAWSDEMQFVYRKIEGDFELVARIVSHGPALSQAGLSVREDLSSAPVGVSLFYSPASSAGSSPVDMIQSTTRTVGGITTGRSLARFISAKPRPAATPAWLKIVRVGNDQGNYWSRDGIDWIPVSSGAPLVSSVALFIGLSVSSGVRGTTATATFDNVYLGPPRLRWKTSWVGNTFGQSSQGDLTGKLNDGYVTAGINALWVAPDGSCWTNTSYDEAGQSAKVYKDGRVVRGLPGNNKAYEGSVTGDGSDVYLVSGSDVVRPKPDGSYEKVVFTGAGAVGPVSGLAARGGPSPELYVANRDASEIIVVDTRTMSEVDRFPFEQGRPGPMAVDGRGDLWIIQEGMDYPLVNGGPAAGQRVGIMKGTYATGVYCYTKSGGTWSYSGRSITDMILPTAVAVDTTWDRLLVTNNGPEQSVRIYDHLSSAPTLLDRLGTPEGPSPYTPGGIFFGANPGLLDDPEAGGMARFYNLTGVGVDAEHNIYVAGDMSGADLRKFTPNKTFVWGIRGSRDSFSVGDFDPDTDGRDLFTDRHHYSLKYESEKPGEEWRFKGFTFDPYANILDSRFAGVQVPFVRRFGPGRPRFMFRARFDRARVSDGIDIFRFEAGKEIAIPCGGIYADATRRGSILWVDANGDGRDSPSEDSHHDGVGSGDWTTPGVWYDVDAGGDIWRVNQNTIVHMAMTGINAQGAPVYSFSGTAAPGSPRPAYEDLPTPAPFTRLPGTRAMVRRIQYDRANDALYLSGNTPELLAAGGGISMGAVLQRYDHFLQDPSAATPRYGHGLVLPTTTENAYIQSSSGYHFKAFDVAGDYLFVWDMYGEIHVYDAATAAPVINIGPGPEVDGQMGWANQTKQHAFKRSNGEYVLTMEDSAWHARNLLYRWTPASPAPVPTDAGR